jgi:leukotriene-A4 hydrolase
VLDYETSPDASALAWLTPEQTCGKQHPYVFSQCQVNFGVYFKKEKCEISNYIVILQAIHARSLLPCQDTPAVKFTYNAVVSVNLFSFE